MTYNRRDANRPHPTEPVPIEVPKKGQKNIERDYRALAVKK